MNVQTFVYNENFYKKLALTIAIIRLTPSHMTPKDYTIQLQNNFRRKKIDESLQCEQILSDIRSRRKSISINIPKECSDLLEYHNNFLQNIFIISTEFNIEIQIIIIETIDRIFQLIRQNLCRMQYEQFDTLFKQIIHTILNFDSIPNIQTHCIQHIRNFIDLILTYVRQSKMLKNMQMLLEQMGYYQSYFLVVFERIITELLNYFNKENPDCTYGLILVNILHKLISSHDTLTLKQIINSESILQQFHVLLYTCLAFNHNNNKSLIISLWNIYGRIV